MAVANLGGTPLTQMEHLMPGTLDKIMEWKAFDLQQMENGQKPDEDNLYEPPAQEGRVSGNYPGRVFERNFAADVYLSYKNLITAATAATVGISTLLWLGFSGKNS